MTLKDTAVLSGGDNPTGTITFTLYDGATLADTETVSVSGNGSYSTPNGYALPTTGTVTGTYQWDAAYSGDTNDSPVSEVNAVGEQAVVSPASPSLSTTPSPTSVTLNGSPVTLEDTAVLSGGDNPTGTITFELVDEYGVAIDTETVSVSGNGSYSTPTGYTLPTTDAVNGGFEYIWTALYNGDGNNNLAVDDDPDDQAVPVYSASPSLSTTPDPTSVALPSSGTVTLDDTATLSGGYYPTGTIEFTLLDPSGVTVDTESVTVSGNGSYTTPTGYSLSSGGATGTYQWDATYAGDSDNNSASDTADPSEQVTVSATVGGGGGSGGGGGGSGCVVLWPLLPTPQGYSVVRSTAGSFDGRGDLGNAPRLRIPLRLRPFLLVC